MDIIHVYTDGACSGNPGPGGAAAVIIFETTEENNSRRVTEGYRNTTNNRMEILAVAIGLEEVRRRRPVAGTKVIVHTDSQIVYGAMAQGWKKRANADVWQRVLTAVANLRHMRVEVSFDKVRGHAGNEWNELADKLAVATRLAENLPADEGYEAVAAATTPEIPFCNEDEKEEEYEDDAVGANEKPSIPYRVTTEGGRDIIIDPFTFNDKRYGLVADAYGRTVGIIEI